MHRLPIVLAAPALLIALALAPIAAQDTTAAKAPAAAAAKPAAGRTVDVYLDCNSQFCDFDFFRSEIKAVNWVRDRQVADVHILVSTQPTGSGGTEFTLAFLGRGRFSGVGDTLKYDIPPAATQDDVRRGLAQVMKVGLVPYVARAAGYDEVKVTFGNEGAKPEQATAKHDPWNFWVFRTSLNGFGNGESSTKFFDGFGTISANRVTENWKTNLALRGSYNQQQYELTDSTNFVNIKRDYDIDVLQVKSLGPHWSAGLTGNFGSSTFLNQRRSMRASPAIEYDLFPYSESTRRQLRIQYTAGISHFDYVDTTIYLKTRETIPTQSVSAALAERQPWGTINVSWTGRNFINDPSKRSADLFGGISLQVVKGLSLNLSGDVSSIRDQVYLSNQGVTDEQILVQQRQLATSYRYFVGFGVSYTFGSIFNNVVNPRFGSGNGGGGITISF